MYPPRSAGTTPSMKHALEAGDYTRASAGVLSPLQSQAVRHGASAPAQHTSVFLEHEHV